MTNETTAPWIESDGVNNLPPAWAVGVYRVRSHRNHSYEWYAYFDGKKFFAASSSGKETAMNCHTQGITSNEDWEATMGYRADNYCDAWMDYQGLQSKSIGSAHVHTAGTVKGETRAVKDREKAALEDWIDRERPSGDVDQVQRAWVESCAYAELMEELAEESPIMASDKPGIAAMAKVKIEDAPAIHILVGGVTITDDELKAILAARPKPAPNNTPRGILAVWNESADHRLGMWKGALE